MLVVYVEVGPGTAFHLVPPVPAVPLSGADIGRRRTLYLYPFGLRPLHVPEVLSVIGPAVVDKMAWSKA